MRLITLNTWYGKLCDPLMQFVARHTEDTDVFCFQEVFDTSSDVTAHKGMRVNLRTELVQALPDFETYYAPVQDGYDDDSRVAFPLSVGLAMCVKKTFAVETAGEVFVYRQRNDMGEVPHFGMKPRNMQYVKFAINGRPVTICNFHGYWYPGTKDDVPERIAQSKKILAFLATVKGAKILCGDFNLLPDTKSLRMLEEQGGLQNLVREYQVLTTRSRLYRWPDKFADYILVSPEVKVQRFEVMQDVVSDHLPLALDFSIQ